METRTFYDSPALEYLLYIVVLGFFLFHVFEKALPCNNIAGGLIRENREDVRDGECDGG